MRAKYFSQFTLADKTEIKNLGRATYNLVISQSPPSRIQVPCYIWFLVSNLKLLFIISFHFPLHVSSHIVLIIRRIHCIYTASCSLCVTLLVWPFGAQAVNCLCIRLETRNQILLKCTVNNTSMLHILLVLQVEVLQREAPTWRLWHSRGTGRIQRAVSYGQCRNRNDSQYGCIPQRDKGRTFISPWFCSHTPEFTGCWRRQQKSPAWFQVRWSS